MDSFKEVKKQKKHTKNSSPISSVKKKRGESWFSLKKPLFQGPVGMIFLGPFHIRSFLKGIVYFFKVYPWSSNIFSVRSMLMPFEVSPSNVTPGNCFAAS